MRFKYQGPLGMPRLTNIGPLSSESVGTSQFIFRGANLASLNNDEFADNTINGKELTLYRLDSEAMFEFVEEADVDISRTAPWGYIADGLKKTLADGDLSLPFDVIRNHGWVEEVDIRPVTGGLTEGTGAAFRFAKSSGKGEGPPRLPMVLYLSRTHIPAELISIEYDTEFKLEHPHIAGWADKGANMAFYYDYDTIDKDLTWPTFRNVSTRGMEETFSLSQDPLDNFRGLSGENEVAAYVKEIGLDHALFGAMAVFTPLRLQQMYEHFLGEPVVPDASGNSEIRQGLAREFFSPAEYLEPLYPEIQDAMDAYEDRLVVMMIRKWGSTSRLTVDRSNIIGFYDGETATVDYDEAVPFTDPTALSG